MYPTICGEAPRSCTSASGSTPGFSVSVTHNVVEEVTFDAEERASGDKDDDDDDDDF